MASSAPRVPSNDASVAGALAANDAGFADLELRMSRRCELEAVYSAAGIVFPMLDWDCEPTSPGTHRSRSVSSCSAHSRSGCSTPEECDGAGAMPVRSGLGGDARPSRQPFVIRVCMDSEEACHGELDIPLPAFQQEFSTLPLDAASPGAESNPHQRRRPVLRAAGAADLALRRSMHC